MKKEIKELWIKALRSNKYSQGETYLRNKDNKFCCLGVLCEEIRLKNNDLNIVWKQNDKGAYKIIAKDEELFSVLPEYIVKISNMEENDCCVTLDLTFRELFKKYPEKKPNDFLEKLLNDNVFLTKVNDSGFSFTEIADLIEQYL